MLHIPLLRRGRAYRSLAVVQATHHRTHEPVAEISQANPGLIRRDLLCGGEAGSPFEGFTHAELVEHCRRAAGHFATDTLPLGEVQQTPEEYVKQVSATTGLPYALVRNNREKIHTALAQTGEVLQGLTRNLELSVLDRGFGETGGQLLSFFPRTEALGVVLPSNSPGVHSLWAPAVALKIALVLKPGSAEPWTPYRMIQAFIRAGVPPEAFCYYPTDHAGGNEILRLCGRGMFFGDATSLRRWSSDARIELHGPGYSKVVIGDDWIDDWEKHLDVLVTSVLANSGRSCVNASGIWVTRHAEKIAEALAARLAEVIPRSADDEKAELAPFANEAVARYLHEAVEEGLQAPGSRDVTASYRSGERLVTYQGCHYLLPTIVRCATPNQPLANREFLFPFASVVEVQEEEIPDILGPSLVVSALTANPTLIERLTASPLIGRLNLGAIPTPQVRWDQPHEGNLFDHLYARRAFQTALAAATS